MVVGIRALARTTGAVLATATLLATITVLAACSGTQVDERNAAGSLRVGDVDAELTDVECAQPGDTLFLAGLATSTGGGITVVDAEVTGERVVVAIREERAGDVEGQQVGQDVTVTREGTRITVEGTFVSFDGPVQEGEVEGTVELSCEPDTDPGGGYLAVEGSEVTYDLVTCIRTDDALTVRARMTTDPSQHVTLRRELRASGWVDRIDASGDITVGVDASTDDAAEDPDAVEGGLFAVQGPRITAEGDRFGESRVGSLELTCGIQLLADTA